MYETEPLADWEQDLLNGTTTVNIKFVVTPTDDPDVVDIAAGDRLRTWNRREALGGAGPYAVAARAYFDAHPPKPVHPLADVRVGEWWLVDRGFGGPFVQHMDTLGTLMDWQAVKMVSARQVYVIPKDEADVLLSQYHPADELLELAL